MDSNQSCTKPNVDKFMNKAMGEESVLILPGIGSESVKRLEAIGVDLAYQLMGKYLVLQKDEKRFLDWLATTKVQKRKDVFYALDGWYERRTDVLKREECVKQLMRNKSVMALPGIDGDMGERLCAAGYKTPKSVFGAYLLVEEDESKFTGWLKVTSLLKDSQAKECYDCLKECSAYLFDQKDVPQQSPEDFVTEWRNKLAAKGRVIQIDDRTTCEHAYQVLGLYLVLKKNKEEFKRQVEKYAKEENIDKVVSRIEEWWSVIDVAEKLSWKPNDSTEGEETSSQ